jgi:hypothetical protein
MACHCGRRPAAILFVADWKAVDGFSPNRPNFSFLQARALRTLGSSTCRASVRTVVVLLTTISCAGTRLLSPCSQKQSCAVALRLPSREIVKSGRSPTLTRVSSPSQPRWPLPPARRKVPALYTCSPFPSCHLSFDTSRSGPLSIAH